MTDVRDYEPPPGWRVVHRVEASGLFGIDAGSVVIEPDVTEPCSFRWSFVDTV
ncbi:MAG TPA: hypothetical protein VJM33_14540 [Microthrixaceae bacterium]|nr:hypothetical protein [Microthrixaceae bacterium]